MLIVLVDTGGEGIPTFPSDVLPHLDGVDRLTGMV